MFLDSVWLLSCANMSIKDIPITIPGDVHTALLDAGIIKNPFFGLNENETLWVHQTAWTIESTFKVTEIEKYAAYIIAIEMIDSFATIKINDNVVLNTTNQFKFYRLDIKQYVHNGEDNKIRIEFDIASEKALERHEKLATYNVPWSEGNNKIPFMNHIRKGQFQSGWDWGLCLVPTGIYRPIQLIPIQNIDLVEAAIEQRWNDQNEVTLHFDCFMHSYSIIEKSEITIKFGDKTYRNEIQIGEEKDFEYSFDVQVENPILWYPHDMGTPFLYDISVEIDGNKIDKRIGLRKFKLVNETDEIGISMYFVINDLIVNAKGSNIIAFDSLPSRITKERIRSYMEDVKDANMNIIRVWGGGYYPNDLYDICDEMGILIWQDFMFACAQYPADDWFLKEVGEELHDQLLRNKHHPCITIYAGDNEDWQAISWLGLPEENETFYRKKYEILNQFLKKNVEQYDPQRIFWPSSPSDGTYNYTKREWGDTNMGDSHYWVVWQTMQPFENYYTIQPRYCSEFGYQSYPSLPTVKLFADEKDWNISSDVFTNHQKNGKGNEIIATMFKNYFKVPTNFFQQLYLSQSQQALAIRTACEYWRSCKPTCRGMMFWQLNDVWPCCSWSSVEYSGRWKQLMYHAKRFYSPILLAFKEDDFTLRLTMVNDRHYEEKRTIRVTWMDFDGNIIYESPKLDIEAESDSAEVVWTIDSSIIAPKRTRGFFYATTNGGEENFYFPAKYNQCDLKKAKISVTIHHYGGKSYINLVSDKPAFFVHLESEKILKFSDSSFFLIPNVPKQVNCKGIITEDDLTIYQLADI